MSNIETNLSLSKDFWPVLKVMHAPMPELNETFVAMEIDGGVDPIALAQLVHEAVEDQYSGLEVEWVKLGGNWVIVRWSDGKVTKIQPQEGDEYNPFVGVMAMAFRKIGRNRLRYAQFDDVVDLLAKKKFSPDDLRYLSMALSVTADAMECEGYDPDYKPEQ